MSAPLTGIKVLDFTHLLPGELTASILCDLGCEIIRIERLTPGLAQQLPPIVKGESLYFWSVRRNEKRLGLDLKREEAKEIVYKLAQNSDIILENFRPGVMSRLGLGYGKIHSLNSRLIYCSISGYGQNTSWSQRPGHDINLQAEAGILHTSRQMNDRPSMPGSLISDFISAAMAAISIATALFEREKTNKGRHLDISMFDSTLWTQCVASAFTAYCGQEPRETEPAYREGLSNYNLFRCQDGRYLAIAPLEPQFWQVFCQRIERPDLTKTKAYGTNDELRTTLETVISKKTLSQWLEIFADADCCVSPVNTIAEAMNFLPARERQLLQDLVHPVLGTIKQIRTPLPFAKKHERIVATFDLRESTAAVLQELGYNQEKQNELAKLGIIQDTPVD
ncbi:MAG: CoA transferase [Candidatus Obscuribacterales bacterium]|nr:CoA transferase [Candidatus Obscuribacterales bacterium]